MCSDAKLMGRDGDTAGFPGQVAFILLSRRSPALASA
jgi:hypothetical protein